MSLRKSLLINRVAAGATLSAVVGTTLFVSAGLAADASRHVRNRFFVKQDKEVAVVEQAPHDGIGKTTAYRYFDDVKDARVIFRKRAIPKGGSIGMHVLTHDEVYYIVSGRGELTVDDTKREVGPDTAIFMHEGADVAIHQRGSADLVLIVSYPPAKQ
jgi:mannose-6-phosphate isomerase-like protein (cupin superfamily)